VQQTQCDETPVELTTPPPLQQRGPSPRRRWVTAAAATAAVVTACRAPRSAAANRSWLHRGLATIRDRGSDRWDRSLARLASFPASVQRDSILASINYNLIDSDQFSSLRIARHCCASTCGIGGSNDGAGTRCSDRDCRSICGLRPILAWVTWAQGGLPRRRALFWPGRLRQPSRPPGRGADRATSG